MKRFLTLYGIEQKLALRSCDMLVFGVAMPVGILVLITMIAGGRMAGDGYTYLESSFASLIAVGICASAFMGVPLTIVDYRDKKILKHFFTTPCSPLWLLGSNVLCSLVYFPMLFLSGATIPYELFPSGLQKLASVLPLTQGIKLMKAVSLGTQMDSVWKMVTLLIGITLVCGCISIKTFRWE